MLPSARATSKRLELNAAIAKPPGSGTTAQVTEGPPKADAEETGPRQKEGEEDGLGRERKDSEKVREGWMSLIENIDVAEQRETRQNNTL